MMTRQFSRFLLILTLLTVANVYAQDQSGGPVIDPSVVVLPVETMPVPEVPVSDPALTGAVSGLQSAPSGRVRDIVLVLDNSNSMKTNDPQFQLAQSVTEFVARLGDDANIAIIVFDQDARLALPLVPATIDNREQLTGALTQLDYNGQKSDSPAGVEMALSELRINGRNTADKYIVFMTDGNVETADSNTDIERSAWLQQNAAVDIADAGITIFGIGFAGAAGSELVSTIALKTGGESFRALQADELSGVFTDIFNYMQQDPGPALIDTAVAPPAIEPPPPPALVETAAVTPVQVAGQEDRKRSMIIMIAAVILIGTLGTLIVLLIKRGGVYKQAAENIVSEAYLYDLNGRTSSPNYKLGKKATMFGRVAGKDTGHLDYIVIPESTIGRRHATIEYKDYAYWIMDQGSINGTFVNDVNITSETRLKHGDRIKLHKVEFDFIMPDMEAAGMTRLAEPAASGSAGAEEVDIDAIKSGMSGQAFDLDLDFGAEEGAPIVAPAGNSDETLLPGFGAGSNAAQAEPAEVTLMPDHNYAAPAKPKARSNLGAIASSSKVQPHEKVKPHEDETLMPNSYTGVNDDATIRPATNSSSDDIFDVTGADNKDQ